VFSKLDFMYILYTQCVTITTILGKKEEKKEEEEVGERIGLF